VAKAMNAIAGKAPIKRNRFIQLDGTTHTVNRELEAKARSLAGLKGYITNLTACPDGTPVTAEFVISAYHRLFEIGYYSMFARRSDPLRATGPSGAAPTVPSKN